MNYLGKVLSQSAASECSHRILIFAIRAIGDIVLITPIIRILKTRFPHAALFLVADGVSSEIVQHNPHLEDVFVIDRVASKQLGWSTRIRMWAQLICLLRRQHFDIAIDLFSGPRSAVLGYLSKAKDRYGEDFRKRGRGIFYNHPVRIRRDKTHLVEQKLELIQSLVGTIQPDEAPLELYLTEKEGELGKIFLGQRSVKKKRRIGLVPGAGSPWRVWPPHRFAIVADMLVDTYDAEIVLLGSRGDLTKCQAICAGMTHTPLDLSGKTTLRELIAILAELDLVIANVTGPMHLATALKKPKVIGLYGAADTIQYAPWGAMAVMLTKGTKEEAYWHKVDYERDYQWLLQITVEDVLGVVRQAMPEWV